MNCQQCYKPKKLFFLFKLQLSAQYESVILFSFYVQFGKFTCFPAFVLSFACILEYFRNTHWTKTYLHMELRLLTCWMFHRCLFLSCCFFLFSVFMLYSQFVLIILIINFLPFGYTVTNLFIVLIPIWTLTLMTVLKCW